MPADEDGLRKITFATIRWQFQLPLTSVKVSNLRFHNSIAPAGSGRYKIRTVTAASAIHYSTQQRLEVTLSLPYEKGDWVRGFKPTHQRVFASISMYIYIV